MCYWYTVSYTHLDVYKRQPVGSSAIRTTKCWPSSCPPRHSLMATSQVFSNRLAEVKRSRPICVWFSPRFLGYGIGCNIFAQNRAISASNVSATNACLGRGQRLPLIAQKLVEQHGQQLGLVALHHVPGIGQLDMASIGKGRASTRRFFRGIAKLTVLGIDKQRRTSDALPQRHGTVDHKQIGCRGQMERVVLVDLSLIHI